jgi:hypothetical protein
MWEPHCASMALIQSREPSLDRYHSLLVSPHQVGVGVVFEMKGAQESN